jgi:hypothetical protein
MPALPCRYRRKKVPRKAKFLTAVWGEDYITRFASLSLPSFLAEGNLPALAAMTDLEVVIMTRSTDVAYFDQHPSFKLLRRVCPVRFVEIDDLVTSSVYGVTLTLAYARAVIACGREMLDTHFVFMNADFVLSDGSLRAMGRHIEAGRSIVLAPSFRAIAEAVEPGLEASIDASSGVLSIPSRQLAAMSMPHPHATTVAKTRTQTFCHTTHPNQFFWQVDENTLLGRYFLIFMLCLKPERVIESINSYCDYALVPELCPSGDEVVMGDSDELFMLELQRADQEQFMVRIGAANDGQVVRDLSTWTTAEHRRAASHDVVFHMQDLPPGLPAARAEAGAFIDALRRRLGPPIPHEVHPYWISGVEAWRFHRRSAGVDSVPPELSVAEPMRTRLPLRTRLAASGRQQFWSIAFNLRSLVYGDAPPVSLFNPLWGDYHHAARAFARVARAGTGPVLAVAEFPATVQRLLGTRVEARCLSLVELLSDKMPGPCAEGPGSAAVVYLLRKDVRKIRSIVERLRPMLARGAAISVFVHHLGGEAEAGNFSDELALYTADVIGGYPGTPKCTFVGGEPKRFLHRILRRARHDYRRFGPFAMAWVLPLLAFDALSSVLLNAGLRAHGPASGYIRHCSSVAICFEDAGRAPG